MKRIILLVSLVCLVINFNGCLNENSFFEQKVNPYFYDVDYIALCATAEYYEVETREEKVIDIEVSLVKTYEQGELYKFAIEPVGYLEDARTTIYFYVTNEKIYRLWAYVYQEGEVIELYNNDELITKYFDTDQKLVENGEIVCQPEEMSTKCDNGIISDISLSEDKVIYSRCDRQENGDIGFYEWFIWERNKGLVDYGSGFGSEGEILYLKQIEEVHN
ncbi:MAG: hypothetical protein K2L07_12975 [Lachnospiraceae bacterium]|nr:hypothetical protein [Lachnospiraceae bacterium]